MIFNSIEFLLFAISFFLLWPFLGKRQLTRWAFITGASFFFYGWWDWRFLFLILASGLIDYFCALAIENRPKKRKLFFVLSLVGNLGALSVFKYSKFFATVLEDGFAQFNYQIDLVEKIPEFALILPVGISFYTFQSLSYTIDVYRGRLKATRNILHFFSYLSMFPQLVAGPIIRAKDFLAQLNRYRITNAIEKWNAIKMIAFGLFQKMVIADNLSLFIDSAFEGKSGFDGTGYWWLVMLAFSFQIYADFSGYSLIARGLSKYMGYHFRMNFNHPYLSKSLREFWTRWHISLSTWFRDYVYIALGGSQRGVVMGLIALAITMMLSGLWHGAKYTFLMWAAIHVVLLIFERLTKWTRLFRKSPLLIPIIFIQATVAWVYFRAENMDQGHGIVKKLFTYNGSELEFYRVYFDSIFFLGLAILIEVMVYFRKNYTQIKIWYWRSNLDIVLVSLAIISILFLRGEGKQFIYFQF
ncbi:MAG: MBOAT family O-acyltransferase [Crocinitomix sp.]|nr:MBOAT family O-acyltransferase [Crocinitomix sp.]